MAQNTWMGTGLLCLFGFLWVACGDPIERHIGQLIEGGEAAEDAKIELNMAKKTAIAPLIEAFGNDVHPLRARMDMADALYKLYLREADERILQTLIGALKDGQANVRGGVAHSLGNLNKKESVGPLIEQLEREADDGVRTEILAALEVMGMGWGETLDMSKLSDEQKAHFTHLLTGMMQEDLPDTLRKKTAEWLENMGEERAQKAHRELLKGNISGAEALLLEARDLLPESKNLNQKLGRFYYDNEDADKGIDYLEAQGMVARARPLKRRPQLDGDLREAAWQGVAPLTEFYQCIDILSAYATEGRVEAYVGYVGQTLYVGIKGYEPSTKGLVAQYSGRDHERTWRDDCIEIFIDANHDYDSYYQLIANSRGALLDTYNDGSARFGDSAWSADFGVATKVEPDYWSIEVEIPAGYLHGSAIEAGTIWGFNLGRIRIGNASEYGQWVPTYGFAHRPDRFGFLIFE